jgi:hypothetical protein
VSKPLPTTSRTSVFERRKDMERLRSQLRTDRMGSWDAHWRSIADYMLPRHQRFLGDPASQQRNAGNRVDQYVVDPTATQSLRTLSAGMMSGLTSPARPWFNLTTSDPAIRDSYVVKVWLDDVVNLMRAVFLGSNLYDTLPQAYLDLGAFGVTAFEVLEDPEDTIRCYAYPIGSYYLACSHRNVVDTCVREMAMTVRQLCERFGDDKLSSKVRAMHEQGSDEELVNVVHVVRPNEDYAVGSMLPTRRKWESVYYEMNLEGGSDSAGVFLSDSGFYDFPIMAPRWGTIGEDVYGWSPGMDELGDVRELQALKRRYAEAVYKMVTPPLQGPASMQNRAIRNVPGGVTFTDLATDKDGLRPLYQVSLPIQYLEQYIEKVQGAINRGFYTDLFRTFASMNREMTAEEVRARKTEEVQALGPVVDRLMGELLSPLVERTFAILERANRLPPAPPELAGQKLKIEYISTMAQIQRAAGLASTQEWVMGVLQIAQIKPEALDRLNVDHLLEDTHTALGVSPKVLVPIDEAQATRSARAQAQQVAQAAAVAESASKSSKNFAQAAAIPPDPSGNNPLTRTLPGPGQAAG